MQWAELWMSLSPAAFWRGHTETPTQLGRLLSLLALTEDAPAGAPPGSERLQDLLDALPTPYRARRRFLAELASSCEPSPDIADRHFGAPPPLWREYCELTRQPVARRAGVRGIDGDGPDIGSRIGSTTEIWDDAIAPGSMLDGQLYAWGLLLGPPGQPIPAPELSPRALWRWDRGRWRSKLAVAANDTAHGAAPRVQDGPGLLLAAALEGLAELRGEIPLTERDEAILWGTLFLPVLAPTCCAKDRSADILPDFEHGLAFAILHPRNQALLVALDALATSLAARDSSALAEVLSAEGLSDAKEPPEERLLVVLRKIFRRFLAKRAPLTCSGFAARLVRRLCGELTTSLAPNCSVDEVLDVALQGSAGGGLAVRLREALTTAINSPGEPRYPKGPAARQLTALILRRWTDPLFLASE